MLTAYLTSRIKWKESCFGRPRTQSEDLVRPGGDFLEVTFDEKPGYFRETQSDQVLAKVDEQGYVLGFSVLRVRALRARPLELAL